MPRPWIAHPALLIAVQFLFPPPAHGQVEPPVPRDTVTISRISLTGYPFVFYNPEVEFAFGGALLATVRLDSARASKSSSAMLSGWYSTNSSYLIALTPEAFLSQDRVYLLTALRYTRDADKFWGFGPVAPDTLAPEFIRSGFSANLEADVSVLGQLKLGLNYDLNFTSIDDPKANPFLLSGDVPGANGGWTSGIGAVIFYDSRDGAFYPTSGGYYKLNFLNTFHWLGSEYTFTRWILDLRQYAGVSDPVVLAFQAYASGTAGDVPFYFFPALGGGRVMRGYFEGRYRDKLYLALQAEVRVRLFDRWGIVGWAGMGDVAGRLGDFRLPSVKPSFGVGIRFALDPAEMLNLRGDAAWGKGSSGVYFDAKEAF
jgi:outer membrane protein assembly factor BamA